jgi:hypothetical protein
VGAHSSAPERTTQTQHVKKMGNKSFHTMALKKYLEKTTIEISGILKSGGMLLPFQFIISRPSVHHLRTSTLKHTKL